MEFLILKFFLFTGETFLRSCFLGSLFLFYGWFLLSRKGIERLNMQLHDLLIWKGSAVFIKSTDVKRINFEERGSQWVMLFFLSFVWSWWEDGDTSEGVYGKWFMVLVVILIVELCISPLIVNSHLYCVQQPTGNPHLPQTRRQDGK